MSFITDIVKFGLGQFGIEATGNTPAAIAQSAITNFLSQKINTAIKKTNPGAGTSTITTQELPAAIQETAERIEREVKVEFKADTEARIPVLYGEGFVNPLLIDARLTNNNCTMWYAVAICEQTGNHLDGTPSVIEFLDVFINGNRVVFEGDGVTIRGLHANGSTNYDLRGLIKVYPYSNGSSNPVQWRNQPKTIQHDDARNVMPGWGIDHKATNLVFALIRIDYNSEQEITGINNIKFWMRNSMKLPGDVINDYMTNTVYGAGIPSTEVDQ